jgi:NAD(P)-dependent dehydrogenase (short-subunit alcohol dehydrogenase family)
MELAGAAAIVSGGASGLGAATARALAADGASVTVADLNEELGQQVAEEIDGRFVRTDVACEADVEAAIQAAAADPDRPLRVVVSCAGIGYAGRIVNREGVPHPLDAFERVLAVNVVGTFNLMRFGAAAMMKAPPLGADGERGVIINTASVAALEGQVGQVAYSAAKGGITAMTLPVARDLSVSGIRVCAIVPGTMDTPLFVRANDEMKASLSKDVLFPHRMGEPDEFAALALAIVKIPYLNAEVLRLDGGIRMTAK